MRIATKVVLAGSMLRVIEIAIPDLLERAALHFDLGEILSEEKASEIENWVKDLSASAPHIFGPPQVRRNQPPPGQ